MIAKGLSPQARGKPPGATEIPSPTGPIPAGTGETVKTGTRSASGGAYPRRHGGNGDAVYPALQAQGLSPQARGKPRATNAQTAMAGPIPAGTGETG